MYVGSLLSPLPPTRVALAVGGIITADARRARGRRDHFRLVVRGVGGVGG